MAYIPLQPNQAPAQGYSGQAVLDLQKQLNAKGAGLKEDSMYGPLTAAAVAKYNTPTQTNTPPTSTPIDTSTPIFKQPALNTVPEEKTIDQDALETKSRSDALAAFQDRINGLNQVYQTQLAAARQAGVGRVGQTTAILANRGLAGSMRGGAITEGTLQQNKDIEDALVAEHNAAMGDIYGKVNQFALDTAKARREALESNSKTYINNLKNKEVYKKQGLDTTVAALIAQGKDPSNLTPDEITNIIDTFKTSGLGLTKDELISAYKTGKIAYDAEQAKQYPAKELSQGESLMIHNPVTGKYEQQGYNPKTSVAGGTGTGTSGLKLTPAQINSTINSIAGAFDNEPIVKNFNVIAEGKKFVDSLPNTTTNPADDQALIYALAKALDPNSVVREGEYATAQKYAQSWINAFGKSVNQALTGTGFLSEQARKNIKDTISSRYNASKTNYDNVKSEYQRQIDDTYAGKQRTITGYENTQNNDPLGIR